LLLEVPTIKCIALIFREIKLWEFKASNAVEAPALIRNNRVYIGDLTGMFYALELETGRKIWEYEADNQISAAANWWSDGQKEIILVGAYDYYLHAIDARTGRGIWKYEAMNYLHAAVAVSGNFAIFGGCDGLLHVVDIAQAKQIPPWKWLPMWPEPLPWKATSLSSAITMGNFRPLIIQPKRQNGVLNGIPVNCLLLVPLPFRATGLCGQPRSFRLLPR
jgi:hypothetical protein